MSNTIQRLERVAKEDGTYAVYATHSDGERKVFNSGLTERGSLGCLSNYSRRFGLTKVSKDLAVAQEVQP
jgi:hypothetical protein